MHLSKLTADICAFFHSIWIRWTKLVATKLIESNESWFLNCCLIKRCGNPSQKSNLVGVFGPLWFFLHYQRWWFYAVDLNREPVVSRSDWSHHIALIDPIFIQQVVQFATVLSVVVLGMCKVCKCTGAPHFWGAPPFDLSRAEKFDYEKL